MKIDPETGLLDVDLSLKNEDDLDPRTGKRLARGVSPLYTGTYLPQGLSTLLRSSIRVCSPPVRFRQHSCRILLRLGVAFFSRRMKIIYFLFFQFDKLRFYQHRISNRFPNVKMNNLLISKIVLYMILLGWICKNG